jgi:hypothetical protein
MKKETNGNITLYLDPIPPYRRILKVLGLKNLTDAKDLSGKYPGFEP